MITILITQPEKRILQVPRWRGVVLHLPRWLIKEQIGGWKTKAMSRYNVANKDRLRAAMEKGGRYVQKMAMLK